MAFVNPFFPWNQAAKPLTGAQSRPRELLDCDTSRRLAGILAMERFNSGPYQTIMTRLVFCCKKRLLQILYFFYEVGNVFIMPQERKIP